MLKIFPTRMFRFGRWGRWRVWIIDENQIKKQNDAWLRTWGIRTEMNDNAAHLGRKQRWARRQWWLTGSSCRCGSRTLWNRAWSWTRRRISTTSSCPPPCSMPKVAQARTVRAAMGGRWWANVMQNRDPLRRALGIRGCGQIFRAHVESGVGWEPHWRLKNKLHVLKIRSGPVWGLRWRCSKGPFG
jgi:hypothetical protein